MAVYDSSVLGEEDPEEQRRGFKKILDAAVDPALEMCRRMADLNTKDTTGWERSVFLINCLDYLQVGGFSLIFITWRRLTFGMQTVMNPFTFTNERIEELEVLLQGHVKVLTEEHVSIIIFNNALLFMLFKYHRLLQESGLLPLMEVIEGDHDDVSSFLIFSHPMDSNRLTDSPLPPPPSRFAIHRQRPPPLRRLPVLP